jgi:hypothetical protein
MTGGSGAIGSGREQNRAIALAGDVARHGEMGTVASVRRKMRFELESLEDCAKILLED